MPSKTGAVTEIMLYEFHVIRKYTANALQNDVSSPRTDGLERA